MTSKNNLNKQLQKLDQIWSEKAPESYASLKQALSSEQFDTLISLYKNEIPVQVRTLFEWKGGQSALVGENVFSVWRLMQFTEVIMEYESNLELFEMGEFSQENWWRPEWIPLLVNGEGATLCYDPLGVFEGQSGQLILVSGDDPNRSIFFPNLESFINASIESLELKEPFQSPSGYPVAHQA